MPKILIAGYKNSFSNYIDALNSCQAGSDVAINVASIHDYHGLLLPGGYDIDPKFYNQTDCGCRHIDSNLDRAQLYLTEQFIRANKPVLGICRGHQIINVFFGGTLIQHLETSPLHQSSSGDVIHATSVKNNSVLHTLFFTKNLYTNSCHHQAVEKPGKDLIPIQYTADNTIEAMIHKNLPVFCVQWHPERMMLSHSRKDTPDGTPVFAYFVSLAHEH